MKGLIASVGFVLLWILTFIPAWILVVKLAVATLSPKKRWVYIVVLFLIYALVIVLPYAFVLVTIGGSFKFAREIIIGVIVLTIFLGFIQVLGAEKIQRSLWKYYALFYDNLLKFYPYRELVELVGNRALDHMKPGSKVVDLGAGTGNVSAYILAKEPDITLEVVEPIGPMMRRAKSKLTAKAGLSFYQQDALGYLAAVQPSSLDVVILSNVLYIIEDRDRFWDLLLKALAPHGVAIITNSDRAGSKTLIEYHKQHANKRDLYSPGLLMVGFIDNLISQFAKGGTFHFISFLKIEKELKKRGATAADVVRCYGGSEHGVNLLFTVTKHKQV